MKGTFRAVHGSLEIDFIKELASFDYRIIFELPKEQAAWCYGCLINSFSVRGWVAKELITLHIEEYMDLVNHLRYSYITDDKSGHEKGDFVIFLCGRPELCQKVKTLTVFQLGCLCVYHFPASIPDVRFSPVFVPSKGPALREAMEPLQSYLLPCNPEANIFTEPTSVSDFVELLEIFG